MEQEMQKSVEKFVAELCQILNVPTPKLVVDNEPLQTETKLARLTPPDDETTGYKIYIKPVEKPTPDLMFAIAHELRHEWQFEKRKEVFFKEYHLRAECRDVEEYNNQLAELDAHAFAAIVMVNYFGLEPQFNGLSENTKRKIKERVKDIVDNWDIEID